MILSSALCQVSLPSVAAMDWVDPRDVKLGELERVINQYQVIISRRSVKMIIRMKMMVIMMMMMMIMMMVRTSWRM